MTGPTATMPDRPETPARGAWRSRLINIGLMAIAFGLLAWTIRGNREQIREVFAHRIDPAPIVLGFAIYMAATFLTFFRWWRLVRAVGLPLRYLDAMRLGLIGIVFNLVIPGAVGGDVIKAAFLCREQPTKKTQAIGSIVIDRILGLLGLFLLAALMGITAYGRATPGVRTLILCIWGAVACGITGVVVLLTPALYRPFNRLFARKPKLKHTLEELEKMAGAYRTHLSLIGMALAISVFIHSMFVTAFYAVSAALFPKVPSFIDHLVIVPIVLFTTAVPLPFGALGVSEQASAELFKLVSHPGGAVAMMGFRLLMYAGGLVSMIVYLANLRQVRSLEAEAEHLGESEDEPTS